MIYSRVFLVWHCRSASTSIESNIQTIFVGWHCAGDLHKRQLLLVLIELDITQLMFDRTGLFSKTCVNKCASEVFISMDLHSFPICYHEL
jgi:hypothetical protein